MCMTTGDGGVAMSAGEADGTAGDKVASQTVEERNVAQEVGHVQGATPVVTEEIAGATQHLL